MNEPVFNTDGECTGSVQCSDEFRPGNEESYNMIKFGKSEYWHCIDPTCPLMTIHPHSLSTPSVGKIRMKGDQPLKKTLHRDLNIKEIEDAFESGYMKNNPFFENETPISIFRKLHCLPTAELLATSIA